MTTVAVAGATGTVGRHVVTALTAAGHQVVPLSRSVGVDISTGNGLPDALHGVDAVIDVLNVPTQSAKKAKRFFGTTTANLLAAEQSAGVRHHVLLSIVGIDAAAGGYYAGKLHQEQRVKSGPVPWTILRAAQFHEFAGQLLATAAVGPLSLVPRAHVRPIAASEVGAALAGIAAAEPQHATVDLRGPNDEDLIDMARRVAAAQGHRWVVPIRLPGRVGRAMRDGALTGDASAREGTVTFTEWLATEH